MVSIGAAQPLIYKKKMCLACIGIAQVDVFQEMERWQGNFTEAGGREIVGILHVSSDNVELEYEQ